MRLVCCALQTAAVGNHYLRVFVAFRIGIYHYPIQHTCFCILAFYVQVVTGDITIEDTLRDIQLGRFLSHTPEQGKDLFVGLRTNLVLEIETPCTYQHNQYQHRH